MKLILTVGAVLCVLSLDLLGTGARADTIDDINQSSPALNGAFGPAVEGGGNDNMHAGDGLGGGCDSGAQTRNLTRADSATRKLQAHPLLKHADVFQAHIKKIHQMPNAKPKSDAYLHLVGVNPANFHEVVNLVQAKDASSQNVKATSDHLKLTPTQARLLINTVTAAIRGD